MAFQEKLEVAIETVFDSSGMRALQRSLGRAQREAAETQAQFQSLTQLSSVAPLGGDKSQGFFSGMQGFEPSMARSIRETQSRMERFRNTVNDLGIDVQQLDPLVGSTSAKFDGLGSNAGNSASRMQLFRNKAGQALGVVSEMAPSIRSLQMRLLGLQFTMLTVAFIFGGLMTGALGAVGAFQILGNTLKFLFLPTALSLLDPLLNIQDAVLGMDEETRKMIGDIFLAITVFSVFIGLAAALAKPLLGLVSLFGTLGSVLTSVLGLFFSSASGASTLAGALSSIGSGGVIGGLLTIASTILTYIPHIAAVIAIVTALLTIFNRFPGVTNAIVNTITTLFMPMIKFITLLLDNMMLMFKGVINVITGLTTFVVGLLTGQFGKAAKGLEEIFFGLNQIFVKPFINLVNFIIQTVLPKIAEFATLVPRLIIDGLLAMSGLFEKALKAALPKWLFDMVKGSLNFGQQTARTAKDLLNVPQQFLEGLDPISAPKIGKDFKPSNQNQNQNNVQQNNINVEAEVNNKEETPEETGRKLGQGISQGMRNQTGDFSTGT